MFPKHVPGSLKKNPSLENASESRCVRMGVRELTAEQIYHTGFRMCRSQSKKNPCSIECRIWWNKPRPPLRVRGFPPAPINHVNIFKGWPLRDAPLELVQLWYKICPWPQMEMKNPTRLSNKTSTVTKLMSICRSWCIFLMCIRGYWLQSGKQTYSEPAQVN